MKLAYLSGAPRVATHSEAETSGPRSHVLGVIGAFEKLGWNVDRYIVGDKVPVSWTKKGSETKVSKAWMKRFAADLIRIWFRFINARKAFREIGPEVDMVYERFAAMQAMGRIFQKKGVKWVLETNAPLFYEAKQKRKSTVLGKIVHMLEIKAYRDCDYLVCVSEKLKEIIVAEGGIDPTKIIVLPNGVDTDFFDPSKIETTSNHEGMVIGFVGTLREWQRLDLLLKAVASLNIHEIQVTIVGDGPGKESWEKLANDLGIEDQVRFIGRVNREKVPSYLKEFDIGYSAPESMDIGMYLSPLKLYEYMAMGLPVLASSSEDSINLIDEDKTGFTIPKLGVESIKEKIKHVFATYSSSQLEVIGKTARERIIEKHSWISRISYLLSKIKQS